MMCKKKKEATCQRKWKMRNSDDIISYLLLHDEIRQFHTLLAQTQLWKFLAERYISDSQFISAVSLFHKTPSAKLTFSGQWIIRKERRTKQSNTVIANGKATHAVSLPEQIFGSVCDFLLFPEPLWQLQKTVWTWCTVWAGCPPEDGARAQQQQKHRSFSGVCNDLWQYWVIV